MAIKMPAVMPAANDKIVDKVSGKPTTDLAHASGFASAMGDAKTQHAPTATHTQSKSAAPPKTTAQAKSNGAGSAKDDKAPTQAGSHPNSSTATAPTTSATTEPGFTNVAPPATTLIDGDGDGKPDHDLADASHKDKDTAATAALIPGLIPIASAVIITPAQIAQSPGLASASAKAIPAATLDTWLTAKGKTPAPTTTPAPASSAPQVTTLAAQGLTALAHNGGHTATAAAPASQPALPALAQAVSAATAHAPTAAGITGGNPLIQTLGSSDKSQQDPSGLTQILTTPGTTAAMPITTASATTSASTTLGLPSPVGTPPWQQELGQMLVQLSQRGDHEVKLHLNPPDLGMLQVTLHVGHDGAQAQFLVSHVQVRDAVQQALPQLRQALANQGIALGQTSVGQQSQQQYSQPQRGSGSHRHATAAVGGVAETSASAPVHTVHLVRGAMSGRGVDTYA